MSSSPSNSDRLDTAQWRVLWLLVFSVCINYIDRGNLSVAAPQLISEMKLSATQMGALLSAFFWTYAVCQIIGGWLVDRYDVRYVYGIGFLLWSLATAATGLVGGFVSLFVLRLLLGMGEAVSYPSYSKIIAGNFSERYRGIANAWIDAGSKCGPALGNLIGGMLVAELGWRYLFIGLGFGSLIWIAPWFIWGPRDRAVELIKKVGAPSFGEILSKRDAWGTFIGLFCGNYVWYFLLTWLPFYLVRERQFSLKMMAVMGSLPFLGIAITSVIGGYLSDHWIAKGASPTRIRKLFVVGGLILVNIMLPAVLVKDNTIAMVIMMIASLCFGFYSSNLWAITQTLAGPVASGKWTGMQNGIGNLAGVVAPFLTGVVVDRTGQFFLAFVAASIVSIIGAASFQFIVGPVKAIQWRSENV
jgi:ACS family D-galactonate transporter-like MFS transporter